MKNALYTRIHSVTPTI